MAGGVKRWLVIGALLLGAAPALAQSEPPGSAAFRARNFTGAYLQLLPVARAGNAQAQFILGQMSHSGLGVQLDPTEAVRWYRMAADRSYAPAQYALARAYADGQGVPVDHDRAIAWLTAAAYGNFVPAILALSDLNDRGAGMAANPEQATEWLRRAARLGSPRGQYILGERLLAGRGATTNAVEGWGWIRSAAQLGEASAMLRLGNVGIGPNSTSEQRVEAMTMLLLAQRTGSDEIKREAGRLRIDVQRHMLPDEIAEANQRARAWQPQPGAADIDGPRLQAAAPRPAGQAGGRTAQGRNAQQNTPRR